MRGLAIVFAMVLSAVPACSGGGGGGGGGSATLMNAQLCDTGFPGDCPGGICRDVVSGQSSKGKSSTNWDTAGNQGTICTRSCSSSSDCTGMSFASANGHTVASESWTCSGGVCVVDLTSGSTTLTECQKCRNTCAGQGSWCNCDAECN